MDYSVFTKLSLEVAAIVALLAIVLSLIKYITTDKKADNGNSTMFITAISNQMEKLVSVIQMSNNSEFSKMIEALKISSARQDCLSASIHDLTAAIIQSRVVESNLTSETHKKVSDIHVRIDDISTAITLIEERTRLCKH